jgi:5-bromo-4-chloroindolyl phosphate hydrolysis protein
MLEELISTLLFSGPGLAVLWFGGIFFVLILAFGFIASITGGFLERQDNTPSPKITDK